MYRLELPAVRRGVRSGREIPKSRSISGDSKTKSRSFVKYSCYIISSIIIIIIVTVTSTITITIIMMIMNISQEADLKHVSQSQEASLRQVDILFQMRTSLEQVSTRLLRLNARF